MGDDHIFDGRRIKAQLFETLNDLRLDSVIVERVDQYDSAEVLIAQEECILVPTQ